MSQPSDSTEPQPSSMIATDAPADCISGELRFQRAPYESPDAGTFYLVRDKAGSERIVCVRAVSADGTTLQLETLDNGKPLQQTTQVPAAALARQAAKGWCCTLNVMQNPLPLGEGRVRGHSLSAIRPHPGPLPEGEGGSSATERQPDAQAEDASGNVLMRLDIQNFSRCIGDIVRANIKFSTQLIKDVGDGPFRAGDYDQSFRMFEQLAVGFNSAVNNSRREIAEGRRKLNAEKGKLSGREIQQRTAAFTRSEQLIQTAEREFSSILEGLRMYLLAQQGSQKDEP